MGKKLDALLGRRPRPSSALRPAVNLALSRVGVLTNQRQARCSLARSDVVHLLGLAQHDRALLRVEQVIKEQNMVDVLGMIEGYCNVVIERIDLIGEEKECPEELKEAIGSLIFASSRTGDFPELQHIRQLFASRYGKEFVARSLELRNKCEVNVKMIQKLSTRQPSLEAREEALKEIAAQNGIDLNLKVAIKEKCDSEKKADIQEEQDTDDIDERFKDSMGNARRKYKDVADAAEQAFQSAAYAAAAAKAAVELSRSRPPNTDDYDKSKGSNISSLETHGFDADEAKTDLQEKGGQESDEITSKDQVGSMGEPPCFLDGKESELKKDVTGSTEAPRKEGTQRRGDRKGPVSMRTRR